MADTTERIIIEVGLTNADYVRKAEETIKKMDELKLQQLQLKAQGEQGGVQWQANAQAIRGLGQELKNYTTLATAATSAEKALADSTENATLAYTSETGSINELRARLSLLTQQRNAMSAADRDGSEAGQQLTAEARALSDQLKELEKATGDTRRNVGNYTESIKDAIANTIPFGNEIVNAASSARAMTVGVNGGTSALKVFKVALASTGVGLLVLAVAALINYLKNLKPLMDFIEVATAGLKAVFEVFGRVVFDVGKTLITALSSPLQLIKDIGNFLAHPIDGMNKLADATRRVGNEMVDAAKAAAALQKAVQDQDDADRAAIANTAKLRLERDRLAVQAKNVSLSEKQRIALLEQSTEKEKAAFAIEQTNSKQRLANLKEEERQFLKNNQAKEASDELLDKIANAEAEVYNQEATSLKFTEKRYNDQAKLQEKAQADREKAAAEEQKIREKQLEADRERITSQDNVQKTTRTQRQNELAEIEADISARKEKFAKYNGTVVALEQERIARIKALNKQYRKDDAAELQANLEAIQDSEIARIQTADDRELMQIAVKNQRKIDAQQKLIDETYERITQGETGLTDLLLSQEQLRDELLTTQRQELQEKNDEIAREEQDKLRERYQQEVAFAEEVKNAKAKIKDEEAANLDAYVGLTQTIFGKETAAGKAALLVEKGIAVARIVIKTQEALAANRLAEQLANASYSALGIFGVGAAVANSIKSAAERTRIIIGGALSAGTVIATTIAGFKDGVIDFDSDGYGSMVRGRGTGTSDSVNARLSNGESVINARSTQLFKPLLNAINQAGGGRPLDDGYSGSAFASGGFYDGASLGSGVQASVDMQNAIAQGISGLQVVVKVKDIITETDSAIQAKVNQNV